MTSQHGCMSRSIFQNAFVMPQFTFSWHYMQCCRFFPLVQSWSPHFLYLANNNVHSIINYVYCSNNTNNTYNGHNKFTVHWNNKDIIMLRLFLSPFTKRVRLTHLNPLQSGSDVSLSHEFRGQKRLFSYCALGRVYERPVRWPPDLGWLTGWTEFCAGNLLSPPRWTDWLQSYPSRHFPRGTWPAGGWRTSHSDISADTEKKWRLN